MKPGRGVTRLEIEATCLNCRSCRRLGDYRKRCAKTGATWGFGGDNPVCGKWLPCGSLVASRLAKENGTQWSWSPEDSP